MMNAILKWSLQHHDGTSDSVPTEMDREKKEFLENAMKTMVEDETKTLKELVEAIKEPEDTEEQVEKKEIVRCLPCAGTIRCTRFWRACSCSAMPN